MQFHQSIYNTAVLYSGVQITRSGHMENKVISRGYGFITLGLKLVRIVHPKDLFTRLTVYIYMYIEYISMSL